MMEEDTTVNEDLITVDETLSSSHRSNPPPVAAFRMGGDGRTTTETFTPSTPTAHSVFVNHNEACYPCLEQPTRVVLYCNGYYLWGSRHGTLLARKRRSDKDEWNLQYDCTAPSSSSSNSRNSSSRVTIQNHRFQNTLAVVTAAPTQEGTITTTVPMCLKNTNNENEETTNRHSNHSSTGTVQDDNVNEEQNTDNNNGKNTENTINNYNTSMDTIEGEFTEEEERFEDEDISNSTQDGDSMDESNQQWCFVKDSNNQDGVMIQSLKTGDNLGINKNGRVILVSSTEVSDPAILRWTIECVTGELCYLSNQHQQKFSDTTVATPGRIRCDIAGVLSLSTNWKGWEVFRLMDCQTEGYVKISSWMHSQWLLCSDGHGQVTTCTHAESLRRVVASSSSHDDDDDGKEVGELRLETTTNSTGTTTTTAATNPTHPPTTPAAAAADFRCSQWAIEKYDPTAASSSGLDCPNKKKKEGVILRSKTHGRLLCLKNGQLRTYDGRHDTTSDEKDSTTDDSRPPQSYHDGCDVVLLEDTTTTTTVTAAVRLSQIMKSKRDSTRSSLSSILSKTNSVRERSDRSSNHSAPSSSSSKNAGSSTDDGSSTGKGNHNWWTNSMQNLQNQFASTATNVSAVEIKQQSDSIDNSTTTINNTAVASVANTVLPDATADCGSVLPKQTIVWDLQAAHLQCYYFLSVVEGSSSDVVAVTVTDSLTVKPAPSPPKSIGPFPDVTQNLRKSEKIQLLQRKIIIVDDDDNDEGTAAATGGGNDTEGSARSTTTRTVIVTKLYLPDKQSYICCVSSNGCISGTSDSNAVGTDWYMEKPNYQEGGSVFRSKPFNCYLSYKDVEEKTIPYSNTSRSSSISFDGWFQNPGEGEGVSQGQLLQQTMMQQQRSPSVGKNDRFNGLMKNPFTNTSLSFSKKHQQSYTMLIGLETIDANCVWNLEPCMPRAVSSDKIKTFAIGTSIAVGTTIAMPFALAGVAAIMGAAGAEAGIAFGIVAAGLSTVEAAASVGAIGATAYLVFRPAENSLTDDHKDEVEKEATAWSKRPFSNWKNW